MNWDLILKASGFVIGAIVSLYQISNLLPGSRKTSFDNCGLTPELNWPKPHAIYILRIVLGEAQFQ